MGENLSGEAHPSRIREAAKYFYIQVSELDLHFRAQRKFHSSECVTKKKPPPWSSIMDPECARRDSPVMTLPAPSSPPSSADPSTPESWLAWATKTATSVMRPSLREVFCR